MAQAKADGVTPADDGVDYAGASSGWSGGVLVVPMTPDGHGPVIRVKMEPTPVTAGFSFDATDLSVDFTDESTGMISGWEWDFGDGAPVSTDADPTHAYASAGTYTVTLSISGTHGPTDSHSESVVVEQSGTWQDICDDTHWSAGNPNTEWITWFDPDNGWGCFCDHGGAGEPWLEIVPSGGWEVGWRPTILVLYAYDYADEFRLLDTAGNVIASGGLGGGGNPISWQGYDIGTLQFRDADGEGVTYGLITSINFFGPPL